MSSEKTSSDYFYGGHYAGSNTSSWNGKKAQRIDTK